jgi:CRISPR-associated protein Cmx8
VTVKSDEQQAENVTLDYELADLPTAQHKAGLAGLVLHIRNLESRGIGPLPEVVELRNTGAQLRFTLPALQTLFDDLYDAETITTEKGKEILQPKGAFLAFWLDGGSGSPWLKLWREMVWSTLRSRDRQRGEYKTRRGGESLPLACDCMSQLLKAEQRRAEGRPMAADVASTIFIGAQGKNAERVPFRGRVEQNLLLHFWQFASPVFVPQVVDIKKGQRQYSGFLLAVPEIADLKYFVEVMPEYWQRLSLDIAGYRPRDSLIDVPIEGGFEFLYHLAVRRVESTELFDALVAIELYHQEKSGNNVRLHAAERLHVTRQLLEAYQAQRDPAANPLFKHLTLGNLINERAWHAGAQNVLASYPVEYLVGRPDGARFRYFGDDVRRRFRMVIEGLQREEQYVREKREDQFDAALARRIYRMVGTYVRHRTKDKSGVDVDDLPKNEKGYPVYPAKYREAREKVAREAFLALRGRREEAVAEYYTGTLCAVPQYVGEEDYLLVGQALVEDPATVKDLAMLALSAHSYLPGGDGPNQPKNSTPEE